MTTTVRSTATNTGNSANASVDKPLGTSPGDVVVVVVTANINNSGDDVQDNNGAEPFAEDWESGAEVTSQTGAVYTRRIQIGDANTVFNFTLSQSQRWTCHAVAYQNPHPTDFWDVAPSSANLINSASSVIPLIIPSIVTNDPNAITVAIASNDLTDIAFVTSPATEDGYTEVHNSGGQRTGYWELVQAAAGASITTSFTPASAVNRFGMHCAVRDDGVVVGGITFPPIGREAIHSKILTGHVR